MDYYYYYYYFDNTCIIFLLLLYIKYIETSERKKLPVPVIDILVNWSYSGSKFLFYNIYN